MRKKEGLGSEVFASALQKKKKEAKKKKDNSHWKLAAGKVQTPEANLLRLQSTEMDPGAGARSNTGSSESKPAPHPGSPPLGSPLPSNRFPLFLLFSSFVSKGNWEEKPKSSLWEPLSPPQALYLNPAPRSPPGKH